MPGWFVKSVTINGENITDIPFDVSTAADDTRIEIVMTDKQTSLSGTVKNPRGEQTTDYTVVVFPDRPREGAMPGRYTRTVRPDRQGLSKHAAFRRATISPPRSNHWSKAANGIPRFANR